MAIFARDCTTIAEWFMVAPLGLPVVPMVVKKNQNGYMLI